LTRPQFHISPSPLSRHPTHVQNPPHQDLSLDLAIPFLPFHKSVHSSCPFDLGERPSCLVLDSDEDVDYLLGCLFTPCKNFEIIVSISPTLHLMMGNIDTVEHKYFENVTIFRTCSLHMNVEKCKFRYFPSIIWKIYLLLQLNY